jgi:hypothetical protein
MIGLDVLMIVYTLWVLSLYRPLGRQGLWIALSMLVWLGLLHWGLSGGLLFPPDISGPLFLAAVFAGVGTVGLLLFGPPALRNLLLGLDQTQLLLAQGVRVFFGAAFLAQAATGVLPRTFGILDGITHIGAGFFGLVAAFSLDARLDGERRAWFANLFGLADILVVASTLALILLPEIGPHHSMMYAVFLPAPIWLWLHLISIARLLGGHGPVGLTAGTRGA